jgi:tetratricopeptide (TPR) repeat protein
VLLSFASCTESIKQQANAPAAAQQQQPLQQYEAANSFTRQSFIYTGELNGSRIIELLLNHRYTELETVLGNLETKFANDPVYEQALLAAYKSFGEETNLPDETFLKAFDEWIALTQSYKAYTAKGMFNSSIGFRARGRQYTSEVTPEQWAKAEKFWRAGFKDLAESIKINSQQVPVYLQMIRILMAGGDNDNAKKLTVNALSKLPQSYYLRTTMLFYLQPKWGNTFEEADKLVKEAQQYTHLNPILWSLQGTVTSHKAYQCDLNEDYPCAVKLYDKALKYGDKCDWLSMQAYAYFKLGQYQPAIDNMNKVLAYIPNKAKANYMVAALEKLKNGEAAQKLYWSDFNQDW